MANEKQYLQWHGQQWRVRLKVPEPVRAMLGRGVLTHPLHTDNLKLANQLKWPIVTRLKDIILKAERALTTSDPLEAEALRYRVTSGVDNGEWKDKLAKSAEEPIPVHMIDPDTIIYDDLADEIVDRAYEHERKHGITKARAFYKLTTGIATPIDHHLTAFNEHKAYPKKSRDVLNRGLRWLHDWLVSLHRPPHLESITHDMAGRFLSEVLYNGRSRKTMALHVSFLREYWKWMFGRRLVTENPWIQGLPEAARGKRESEADDGKRPFEDHEVTALLHGGAEQVLADVIRLSALSGMRLEEICQLQVRDCENGNFKIPNGKTANAKRDIPIHSVLVSIVQRRTRGKAREAFLIGELPTPPQSRESRSDPLSKRFTRYRRKCGVDERPNGKMKSNVDFHSFRRWFTRKARNAMLLPNAGFDEWSVVAIVGHTERGKPAASMTMNHYPGEDTSEIKRRCIEAVKLP